MAHEHRGNARAQHESRHDGCRDGLPEILGQRHIARWRQPAQFHTEEQDHHNAEPEIRRGNAKQRHTIRDPIRRLITLDGGKNAGRHTDQHRNDEGHGGKLRGDRQLIQNKLAYWHTNAPGKAKIARQHIADPIEVLFVDRPIKPELRADLRQHLRVAAFFPCQDQRRIAGHELLQPEDQDGQDEKRGHNLPNPLEKPNPHDAYCNRIPCSRTMPSEMGR